MKSFLQYMTEAGFLKSVSHKSSDGDHTYRFNHHGKDVGVEISHHPDGNAHVNFDVDGKMSRVGAKGIKGIKGVRGLYKKVGKVVRAHQKLGRHKGPYNFRTVHDMSQSGDGNRTDRKSRVTGRIIKKMARGRKVTTTTGSDAWGRTNTIHRVT